MSTLKGNSVSLQTFESWGKSDIFGSRVDKDDKGREIVQATA